MIYHTKYRPQSYADFEIGWTNTRPNYVPSPAKTCPEDPCRDEHVEAYKTHLRPNTEVAAAERLTEEEIAAPAKSSLAEIE
jgi:hypothetical protein